MLRFPKSERVQDEKMLKKWLLSEMCASKEFCKCRWRDEEDFYLSIMPKKSRKIRDRKWHLSWILKYEYDLDQ